MFGYPRRLVARIIPEVEPPLRLDNFEACVRISLRCGPSLLPRALVVDVLWRHRVQHRTQDQQKETCQNMSLDTLSKVSSLT